MGSAVLFDDLVDFFNFSSCFIFSLILIVFTLQLFFLFFACLIWIMYTSLLIANEVFS